MTGTFTVEIQRAKHAPWVSLGSEHPTSDAAWEYLTFLRVASGVDYYAACVRPV